MQCIFREQLVHATCVFLTLNDFRKVVLVPIKCCSEKFACIAVMPSSISAVKTEIRWLLTQTATQNAFEGWHITVRAVHEPFLYSSCCNTLHVNQRLARGADRADETAERGPLLAANPERWRCGALRCAALWRAGRALQAVAGRRRGCPVVIRSEADFSRKWAARDFLLFTVSKIS